MTQSLTPPRMTAALLFLLLLIAIQCPSQAQFLPTLRPVLEIRGERFDDWLGTSVLALGDINGDGWPDFGVSRGIYQEAGRTAFFIFFGGPGKLDATPDVRLKGGWNAVFGDVNGDGYKDLVTVQPAVGNQFDSRDTAYVYFGHAGPGLMLDTIPGAWMAGERQGDQYGRYMAIGDLNRDGFDDLVITANSHVNVEYRSGGKVYVYMGRPNFTGSDVDSSYSKRLFDYIGLGVFIADMNGDGYPDLSTGLNHDRSPDVWQQMRIYHGKPDFKFDAEKPDQILDTRDIIGVEKSGTIGMIFSSVIDINFDGKGDVVTRYYRQISPGIYESNMLVFYGRDDTIRKEPDRIITNPDVSIYRWFLSYAHQFNDINHDLIEDYGFRLYTGITHIVAYPGIKTGMSNYPFARFSKGDDQRDFGESVASLGDINGDGINDILISGPRELFSNFGYAVVLSGDTNLVVDVEKPVGELPTLATISAGYPNPFRQNVSIDVHLSATSPVTVTIHDMLGRVVSTIRNERLSAGDHVLHWNGTTAGGRQAPNGLYWFQVQTGEGVVKREVVLLK